MTDSVIERPGNRSPRNRKQLYVWIGAGVLVGGVIIYRARKNTNTATTDTSSSADTTDSGAYDPTLDNGYYSSGYGDYYPATGVAPSYYDPTTGQYIGGGTTPTTPVTAQITNNAEWAQQATAYLVNGGYDFTAVAAALGIYLAGGTLTNTQMQIVQAALAEIGNPPHSVPAPHVAPPTGQTPPPKTTPPPTTPPPVTPPPKTTPPPVTPPKTTSLPYLHVHVTVPSKTTAVLQWNAIAGAQYYNITDSSGRVVSQSSATYQTIQRGNTSQSLHVTAMAGSHAVSHPSSSVNIGPAKK